jgi:hypothetical protein
MKTAKEREADFRRDLDELLKKHNAELNVTDDGKSYGLHKGICEVFIPGEYDCEGNAIKEYADFRL